MLSGATIIPSHTTTNAVVLMHGYGSNAEDLISLAEELSPSFPQTAFFAPNAPAQLDINSYEWFSLNDFDGNIINANYLNILNMRAQAVVPQTVEYITHLSETYSIPIADFILGGFSQGGLMALRTAFTLTETVKGVIGMSAVPLVDIIPTTKHLPILLTHGGNDPVVPLDGMKQSHQLLTRMNQSVETYVSPYMLHGIDAGCVQHIQHFIQSLVSSGGKSQPF